MGGWGSLTAVLEYWKGSVVIRSSGKNKSYIALWDKTGLETKDWVQILDLLLSKDVFLSKLFL